MHDAAIDCDDLFESIALHELIPASRAFSTHVSTMDPIALGAGASPASLRYWSRLPEMA